MNLTFDMISETISERYVNLMHVIVIWYCAAHYILIETISSEKQDFSVLLLTIYCTKISQKVLGA